MPLSNLVDPDEHTWSRVAALYEEAFPAGERQSLGSLIEGVASGTIRLWVDSERINGFAISRDLSEFSPDVILEYLAVDADQRSSGIGRAMVEELLVQIDAPIVLEVERPGVSMDTYAARRLAFYERLGAREVPFAGAYAMPNLVSGGLLPMILLDLDPARRTQPWTPDLTEHLIRTIWRESYGTLDLNDSSLDVAMRKQRMPDG